MIYIMIFCISVSISAQPLNNSFEEWKSGRPINWLSSDDSLPTNGITQSSDSYDSLYSVQLQIVNYLEFPYPAWLWSVDDEGNFHPVSEKYNGFNGWYKFLPLGNDQLYIVVKMLYSDSSEVSSGGILINTPVSDWTYFFIPLFYAPSMPEPAMTLISIAVIDSVGPSNPGSFARIDKLAFTGPSSVIIPSVLPEDFSLKQNYPNPFNPSTNIEYSLPEASFVELKVFDILGNEVATLVNEEQSAGTYRADFTSGNLSSGFYIARLIVGNQVKTIKMSLLK